MNIIPSSSDESETTRDGFLSTRREIHATVIGLTVGGVAAHTAAWELAALFVFVTLGAKLGGMTAPALAEIRREPWYALGGFTAAVLLVLAAPALSTAAPW